MDSSLAINPRTGQPYKSATALAINHNAKYQPDEDATLLAGHGDLGLAKELGRSIDALRCRRKRLRYGQPPRCRRFTPEEDTAILVGYAAGKTSTAIAIELGRPSGEAIRTRRKMLNNKLTKENGHAKQIAQVT